MKLGFVEAVGLGSSWNVREARSSSSKGREEESEED